MTDRSRIERAYRTIVLSGRALLHAHGEDELIAEICRVAVDVAGYTLAWVGYVDDGAEHLVRPVAHAGFADGYLDQVAISWDVGERGQGPTGRALRTGTTQVVQQTATHPEYGPWRRDATRRGYASSAALPLRDGAITFGVLNLYAPEPGAFDAEEIELLEQVADTLSHGILYARGKRALSAMQRSLEHLSRISDVERLAASLAHDVNNYLAVVLPCLDELAETAPAATRPLVHDAQAALDRAIALNRTLLQAATPTAVDPLPISVDDFLRSLEGVLRTVAGAKVSVTIALGSDGANARIETSSLEQIVLNLVVNARDAMVPDGGAVVVETRPFEVRSPLPVRHLGMNPGRYVAVRVSDSGPGIPAELLDRVFDPFFTTRTAGTGIGLATARSFAHQARGRITVESTVGKGTTFEVLVPRSD